MYERALKHTNAHTHIQSNSISSCKCIKPHARKLNTQNEKK